MTDDLGEPDVREPEHGSRHGGSGANVSIALIIFVLGVLSGLPIALFGVDLVVDNVFLILTVMFAFLVTAALMTALIVAFRKPILSRVVKRTEVEMERFARPLADVARYAAQQKVQQATDAAREVGELMLARYAWVSTRRWMVATITAFVASIAALAGSALLFQQNELLRAQGTLMREQTDRLTEQTSLLEQQIELGEAQRSASIVPEILDIGALIGEETKALSLDGRPADIFFVDELSSSLRGRIIAASASARPYRYLNTAVSRATDGDLAALALTRRTDLSRAREGVAKHIEDKARIGLLAENGVLIDRPVSPERGQLISILFNSRVMDTEQLTLKGADFSFAEVRLQSFGVISMRHALLRFADFSNVQVRQGEFGAAYLEQARFVRSVIADTNFSGIKSEDLAVNFSGDPGLPIWRTQMAGVDFRGATISDSEFVSVNMLGGNFDYALVTGNDFSDAVLAASTFRNAILGTNDFMGANLALVDFDGAYVFTEDFLDGLLEAAAPETFDPSLYTLGPVEISVVDEQPTTGQLWLIPGYEGGTAKAWQVERVREFDAPEDEDTAEG